MTRIKICGVNSEAAFDTAVELGVDMVGFVFFHGSPRHVTGRQAGALSARHDGGPQRVGLFVEPEDELIRSVLGEVRLDKLQIYASERRCLEIRGRFGIRTARAIGVGGVEDLPTEVYGLDCLIVEAKPPAGATRPGGNAVSIDWTITRGWQAPLPWLLAGGLTAENVAAAIAQSGAPGVDVSSGVESLAGVKSPALMRRFVANVRQL